MRKVLKVERCADTHFRPIEPLIVTDQDTIDIVAQDRTGEWITLCEADGIMFTFGVARTLTQDDIVVFSIVN